MNGSTINYTYYQNGAVPPKNSQRLQNDGTTTYSYNSNGDSSIGGWDVIDRMVNTQGTINSYKYDYTNRRASKTITGVGTTTYIYDGQNLIGERGASVADYVFGPRHR